MEAGADAQSASRDDIETHGRFQTRMVELTATAT